MRDDGRNLLRRLAGDLSPVEPLEDENEAWRRLSATLGSAAPARRPPAWVWIAAVGLSGTTAALLLRTPAPPPAARPAQIAALPAPVPHALPALPPVRAATSTTAKVEGLGSAVQIADRAGATSEGDDRVVGAGARVATGRGEARLGLPGGSLALLEAASSARLARLDPDGIELDLESGGIFVHAAKLGRGSLAVRAGKFRVIVHGTGFRVERRDGFVDVGLWHGSIEIRGDGEAAGFFLAPGQKVRFSEARGPVEGSARPLGESTARGTGEEARLLGVPVPAQVHAEARARRAVALPSPHGRPPAMVVDDVARCRAASGPTPRIGGPLKLAEDGSAGRRAETEGRSMRIDLTLADDGRVLQAALEQGATDAKLASCIAEAALHWKLDPPPQRLRGMTFVYPVPVR